MSKFEDNVKTVVEALYATFQSQTMEDNKSTYAKLKELYDNDSKKFLSEIKSGRYNFEEVVSTVIDIPNQKNMYILNHIISGLYEHFLTKTIENTEGSACSVDKANFTNAQTFKALKERTNLSLYDNYKGEKNIPEKDWDKQAFWSPKSFKDTDAAMECFWNWYLIRK